MSFDADHLKNLARKIIANPEAVNEFTDDEVTELRKFIAPTSGVPIGKPALANVSIIHPAKQRMQKSTITAVIGLVNNACHSYEPTQELENEQQRFKRACAVPGADIDAITKIHDERRSLIIKNTRDVIYSFLDSVFKFNPDIHVRGAHTKNEGDPERLKKDVLQSMLETKARSAKANAEKLQSKPENLFDYLRGNVMAVSSHTAKLTATLKQCLESLATIGNGSTNDGMALLEDAQGILLRNYQMVDRIGQDLAKIAAPFSAAESLAALQCEPPVDVFYHLNRYITNNYENLELITDTVYNEKKDLEDMIILYDVFSNEDDARDHRIRHNKEFKLDVYTISNGGPTIWGPFAQNRERIEYYNKNTDVLKAMTEQLEADHKLGKDLMDKAVRNKKRRNILEAGPDDPDLANYQRVMNLASELGAKEVLSKEEKKQIAEARAQAKEIADNYAIPDETVEVGVFYPNADGALEKTQFYTQAEAPLEMQKEYGAVGQYQPKRQGPLEESYVTRTVVNKETGQVSEVKVLKQN